MELKKKKCVPCEGGVDPLKIDEIEELKPKVPRWEVKDNKKLYREFKFDDFQKSLDFINDVGEIAEKEMHHPEISFGWGHAEVELWTHAIDGLHENDFIVAAKIDNALN